jgi:diguanylate cyclase (GGDEF)-like protein
MGLRVKLLLVWSVLLLTPLAILSAVGYAYIDSQLRNDTQSYQRELRQSLSHSLASYFNRMSSLATRTGQGQPIINFLQRRNSASEAEAKQLLNGIVGLYDAVHEYQLIKDEDFANPVLAGVSSERDSTMAVDPNKLRDMAGGQPSLFYLRSVQSGRGHMLVMAPAVGQSPQQIPTRYGYVVFVALTSAIDDIVMPTTKSDTQFFVVDGTGNLLSNRDDLPFNQFPDIERVLPQRGIPSREIDNLQIGQINYNVTLDKLSQDFWLVSLTDRQILADKKTPYIAIFIMTMSLTLLLSGVIYNVIVTKLAVKPIQHLINATKQIARGDFKPKLDIRSKDELGELTLAFRQMGKQLMHTSKRIRQLAYYDPLTQLPNRTTLRETLNRLITQSKRAKWKTAVLFIDLDDFKKVNDRLGHEAGDELLIQISERLKNRLRQSDLVFEQTGVTSVEQLISRRGGDEFNAILTSIRAPHDAAVVAERIIQDLNEPFFISNSEIHVGASVGIAIFPDDGSDADTLLHNADLAMYEAKAKGKNNYHIFTSAINEQVHQRLALEHALQVALVQNQFRLYYQPKVDLRDMRPVGFEALVRWQHPEKGMILPSKFIPVAEESNLIRDIGNWILGESMQQIQLWEDVLPPGVRIAINISARQLAQTDLVDQLRMMMEHFSLSPERLEIELTETSVLQDEHMAVQHLTALRALGVEISLDDFGTGYSSLSFLRKLPIDTVKIDRSFTASVIHNSEARAIVISLLGLCKELKVNTIAEGIETAAQLQFLLEHGCEYGQGFLFSEPMPADEVVAFLQEPNYLATTN